MEAHRGKLFREDAAAAAHIEGWCVIAIDVEYFIEEPLEIPDTRRIHRRSKQVENLIFVPPDVGLVVVESIVDLTVDLVRSGLHMAPCVGAAQIRPSAFAPTVASMLHSSG